MGNFADWAENYRLKHGVYPDHALQYYIDASPGAFFVGGYTKDPNMELDYIEQCEQLVDAGVLNRWGSKRGWYIPRKLDLVEMDYINADDTPIDIWLPFGASDLVELFPGNVIIIGGCKDAGKTCVVLNIIGENQPKGWDINYFSSEMAGGELKKRLKLFDYTALSDWDFKAYERADDFHDVIVPGKNSLNIIDFLEVHDEFYVIGRKIKEIHDRLKGGIAVIALQKNPGVDLPLGGWRGLEVTRFALALDHGRVKIVVAKNFRQPDKNPVGLMRKFKILHGSQIIADKPWYRETKE